MMVAIVIPLSAFLCFGMSFIQYAAATTSPRPTERNTKETTITIKDDPTNRQQLLTKTNRHIIFEKCQHYRIANDRSDGEDTKQKMVYRLVMFRLCAEGSTSCLTEDIYTNKMEKRIMGLHDYLNIVVPHIQEEQEAMCTACEENCPTYYDDAYADDDDDGEAAEDNGDDGYGNVPKDKVKDDATDAKRRLAFGRSHDVIDCDQCISDCEKIEVMEENNYMDATNFVQCVQIQEAGDDGTGSLYAGPMCASSGSKITIGVFSDEDCMYLERDLDVEDYITNEYRYGYAVKLSHALLKTTYDNIHPISCAGEDKSYGKEDSSNEPDSDNAKQVCIDLDEESRIRCMDDPTFSFQNKALKTRGCNWVSMKEERAKKYCNFIMKSSSDDTGHVSLDEIVPFHCLDTCKDAKSYAFD